MSEINSPHLHQKSLVKSLSIAFFFMLVEIIGGWIASSLALISDALHLFTDVGALFLSLIVMKIARFPRTPTMSYGYHRAEVLGALASALSLWALTAVLIYEATMRFFYPRSVDGLTVFIIAAIGLLANIWMLRLLHHGSTHSINIRSAYLHVIGDLLGSFGVLLAGALLWLTHWDPIDPLITLLFCLGILYSSAKIIVQSIRILMESVPHGIDPLQIEKDLLDISGVKEVHDLHIWAVSSQKTALSAHLVAERTADALRAAHSLIEKKYRIRHMTFQVEDPAHFETKYCYDCEKQ